MSRLLASLRSAFAPPATTPDVELLSRFIQLNDQDAFAELVRRYGPMVFGVCRRTLGDGPDADDAYQATLIVLAKRADTVRGIGRVAGWLHGVATLCAKKARTRRAKRQLRERSGNLPDVPAAEPMSPELSAVLDAELSAIPEHYRTAVVLCELRQLTLDQAAAELGVSRGTVASRLARGREMLGKRLLRRGLMSAVIPLFPAIEPPTAVASESALSLTHEVLRTMTASQLRWLPLAVVPLLVLGVCLFAADPPKPTAPPPKAEEKEKPKRNATVERVKLVGIGGLLEHEAVRKDLGLTKDQIRKIDAEKDKLLAGMKEMNKAVQGANRESRYHAMYLMIQQCGDLAAAYDAAVTDVLTPEQVYRLKQLSLQREGPPAVLGRFAVRELTLTAEQEDKLADAIRPMTKPKLFDIGMEFGKGVPDDGTPIIKQHAAIVDGVKEKAMAALSDAQKKKWKEMVGEELPTEVLVLTSGDGFLIGLAIKGN